MDSEFLDQVIMNKGTLTAIVQHCVSCYFIFAIFMFHLHWHNAHTDHLRFCFPVILAHFKSLFKPAKLLIRFPSPSTAWFPSVLKFLFGIYPCREFGWFPLQLEQINPFLIAWNRSYLSYSLVSSIHIVLLPLLRTLGQSRFESRRWQTE